MDNDPVNWLFDEGGEAEFDQADTILITGMSSVALQNWANRGIFKPSGGGGSQGLRRKYSAHDLVVLAMSGKLVDLNVSANVSLSLAMDIWIAALKDVKRTQDPSTLASCIAFVKTSKGGALKTSIVSGSNKADFSQLLDGQPVIMFAAGVLIKATAAKAMEVAYIAERPAGYAKDRKQLA